MNIIPCGHRIVVRPVKLEDVDDLYRRAKSAGIELASDKDVLREQMSVDRGFVEAIGPSAFRDFNAETPWCAVGDIVAFAKYSGKAVKDLDTEDSYIVLNDEDIVCILKKGEQ